MASRTLPGLGLNGFWALGEDGWNGGMDANLLKLSVLAQCVVKDVVNATPGSPVNGDVYLFGDSHPTNADAIAVYDNGAWTYYAPTKGWRAYDLTASALRTYDGASWTTTAGGLVDAPSDGTLYGRKNGAWAAVPSSATYRVGFFFTTTPTASEVLLRHVFTDAVTFPDEFVGAVGNVGTNPAASFVLTVAKNGATVGTITISTAGAFAFVTTGTTVAFAAGDVMTITGPSSADTTIANVAITLKGSL